MPDAAESALLGDASAAADAIEMLRSVWLTRELAKRGAPVVCIDARVMIADAGSDTLVTVDGDPNGRQQRQIACYVSSYPHLQDPNAAEPQQVYRFASEAEALAVPAMIFIGEYEQYQRRRSIETAVAAMKAKGRDVTLVIYPGVGRGFDFRPPNVRTFADDLATKDANLRTAHFILKHLAPWQL